MRTNLASLAPIRALALGIALACAVSGCAVGPSYKPPATTLSAFHNAANASARAASVPAPALETWWTGFRDPELERIVQRALAENLDLAGAFAQVERSRAAAREAGAQLLPTATLNAQAASLHQSLQSPLGSIAQHFPGYDRDQTLHDFGPAASWELDLFGGLRRGAEAARAEAQAAEADRLGVRISVAAEAADAYLELRGDQARLELARQQIKTDEQLLELVRLRFVAGAASDREVAQAEALLAEARASVPPLRVSLEGQMNRLDVLMGAQPRTYAAELSAPAEIPSAPAVTADKPTELLRRRPDVIAAERRLAASDARIGVALAEYYPKISLSGLLGFESLSSGQLFSSGAFQPAAIGALRWRLFDFGRVDAEVAQARAAQAYALTAYRQSVLRAAEDVEDALTSLVQLEAQSAELTREVAALTRARDTSEEDYKAGAIALTDVLDADRQLLIARDSLARNRADDARAAVAVFRALGGGW
jgi:NodT family efflux transporter outer membrane factor (OMF) lipoprotein